MSQAMHMFDADQLDRWEKIIKIENLQADTALKQAQNKFTPWQVATAGFTAGAAVFTAGAAVAGAFIALAHAHVHWL